MSAHLFRPRSVALLGLVCGLIGIVQPGSADLAAGGWYDQNSPGAAPDWHYRVPVTIPSDAGVHATIRFDIDFDDELDRLGIRSGSVDFDERSVRVVRPNGQLADFQEFSDLRWRNRLDNADDGRGEVQFTLADPAAAGPYYVYFDIVENGVKAASAQAPINANFEHSAGATPTSWTTGSNNTGGGEDNRVIDSKKGAKVSLPAECGGKKKKVDNGPNQEGGKATGESWHLLGYRDQCEDGTGVEEVYIERQINVPGLSPGELAFWFQVQGYDGLNPDGLDYDYFQLTVNGVPVDHTQLTIEDRKPDLLVLPDMFGRPDREEKFRDHKWRQIRLNLSAFAGTTISLRLTSRHSATDNLYKTWIKLDDFSWSVHAGILGRPQGFGVNVIEPGDTAGGAPMTSVMVGEAVQVRAIVDAAPTRGVDPVTADILNPSGTPVASGVRLFNDGTHGDAVAGDAEWANDGSDAGNPTYRIGLFDPLGVGWFVRVIAADASIASTSAPDGLIHIDGTPEAPVAMASYFNVDEQEFRVRLLPIEPDLVMLKQNTAIYDPTNLTVNPKSIPGGHVRYTLSVSNAGLGIVDANSMLVTDPIPIATSMCVSSACAGGGPPVVFDDAASPTPTGLTFNYGTDVSYSTDGVDYTYVPSPDLDGFDPNVRFVQINPKGAFLGSSVLGDPRFDVHLIVRVD